MTTDYNKLTKVCEACQGKGKIKLDKPWVCFCGKCVSHFQTCTPCLGFGRVLLDGTDLWKWANGSRAHRKERLDYAIALMHKLGD